MGTKQTTNSTQDSQQKTTFDPQSMQRYQGWASALMPQLQSMFSNPLGSPFFNQNLQASTKGASALAGRNMSNSLLNFNRSGVGAGSMFSGARNSLMGQNNRYGAGMQFQGFNNAVNNAQTNMWNAGQLGSSLFQPLQTGGTMHGTSQQVQTTGGLGTWLPQLAGAAIGGLTGGLGGMLGGATKMLGGAGAQALGLQGNNPSFFSGQGSGSFFQPTMMPSSNTLTPPSSFGSYNPFAGGIQH